MTVTDGKVQDFHVLKIDEIGGYRVIFDWYPNSDKTDPVQLRAFIRNQDRALSETWLYQYFPPAPDQSRYPDWQQS